MIVRDAKIITAEVDSVVFENLDFTNEPFQIFRIFAYGGGTQLVQTSVRINDDDGANYDVSSSSFAQSGYTLSSSSGDTELVISPGYPPDGEQNIMEVSVVYTGSLTYVSSRVYTNGSGAGDVHFVDGKYTQSDLPVKIELFMNLDGVFGTGKWGVPSTLERMTMQR